MKLNCILVAVSVVGLLATTTAARAAVVYDTITVYNGAGGVIASANATPAEVAANPNKIFYVGGVAVDGAEDGNYGMVLAGSKAVDIFGIASGGPDGLDLAFAPGGEAANYGVQNPVADTGMPISMTLYLDPSLQAVGDTAYFTATGNINIGVPEPATWAMLILGMGLVGLSLRQRKIALAA